MRSLIKTKKCTVIALATMLMPMLAGCAHIAVQNEEVVTMVNDKTNNNFGQLSIVTYSRGGGSQGGRYFLELVVENNGKCRVDIEEKEFWNSPEKKESRYIDGSCLSKLQEVIAASGITSWADLPKSDIFAYDAPTTSISIMYKDGRVFNIYDHQALPDKWYDTFDEIRKVLSECR